MPVAKNIGLFVNPVAGNNKPLKISSIIREKLLEQNISFEVFDHTWPAVITSITEAWIIGGDGTLNYFINNYKDITIPLAIFPAGTGNDFSWKLYGNMEIAKQVVHVLQAPIKKVDAATCNELLYLVGVGIGFEGAVLRSMKRSSFLRGHMGYLWAVIKTIFSFKECSFDVKLETEHIKDDLLLVIINNSTRTGGGFLVAPKARLDDGLLDIVLCKKLGLIKRLRSLPVIEKGKHLHLPFIRYYQEPTVSIVALQELYAHLDGELISAKTFRFNVLPGQFLFRY